MNTISEALERFGVLGYRFREWCERDASPVELADIADSIECQASWTVDDLDWCFWLRRQVLAACEV